MKGDGVLNLLIFQAFQDVRMASSLVRSTIRAKSEHSSVTGFSTSAEVLNAMTSLRPEPYESLSEHSGEF